MTTLYGIKNCDSVKKARRWLETQAVDYRFHDFRQDGISRQQVEQWIATLGWETVVNKRSTTWKQLDDSTRQSMTAATALLAILDNPTLIKRPLLETGDQLITGFKDAQYAAIF